MIDPTPPSPTGDDPNDPNADVSDRAWFRAHLDPVVGADSSPDDLDARWEELAAAAAGAAPLPLAARSHRRAAVFIGAAAAVLAVVALAVVIIAGRGDDTIEPLVTEAEQPTGWYVPEGLPDGWQLESAEAYPGPKACKRRGTQWSDPTKDRSVALSYDGCGRAPTQKDVPDLQIPGAPPELNPRMELHEVDLGNGVTATGIRQITPDSDAIDVPSLSWNSGGGAWTVQGLGVGYDGLVSVAKRLAADPGRSDLGIDGLEAVDRWSAPERDHTPQVQVNLVNPDGLRTSYYLSLPGGGEHAGGSAVLVPITVEGQPNRVFRYDTATFWAGRYGGSWPGADLIVYRWTTGPTDPEHLISDASLEQMIASLRPATTDEWRAFLATATGTVSPVLLDAPSLAALAEADVPRPGEPSTEATTTTSSTTTSSTTTSTTAPTIAPTTTGPGAAPSTTTASAQATSTTATTGAGSPTTSSTSPATTTPPP